MRRRNEEAVVKGSSRLFQVHGGHDVHEGLVQEGQQRGFVPPEQQEQRVERGGNGNSIQ